MKLLVTFSFKSSFEKLEQYGSLTYFVPYTKEITKKNVDLTYLTYGSFIDNKYSNLLKPAKIIPIYSTTKSRSNKSNLLNSLLVPFKFKRLFKEADLIRTFQIVGSWVAVIGKILFKKKLLVRTGYEWFIFFLLNEHLKKKKRNYLKYLFQYITIYILEYLAYKLADGIILSSQMDINFIIKAFHLEKKAKKNKILHLYNYIDIDLFKPMEIQRKYKNVLFIGRLDNQKNLFNLINAFVDLPDFTLNIVGRGPYKNELKKLVKKLKLNVKFLGTIPNYEIPKILNQCEIFILPSYYEGNPKVLLEAMSCGIPCIGTNVWGIKNIITHKENGYLCNLDSSSIKKAIIDLYKDVELRKKISVKSREFVIVNCSPSAIVQAEYLFYKKILKI